MIGTVVAGDRVATVSWQAPVAEPVPIVAYIVTPWVGSAPQTPMQFNSTATTQIVTGLTNNVTYTFSVLGSTATGRDRELGAIEPGDPAGDRSSLRAITTTV